MIGCSMKKQIVFIHGGDSFSKYEDFLSDLKNKTVRDLPNSELVQIWTKTLSEDLDDEFEVFMPTMPNKQNAQYDEWKIWFERYFEYLRSGVILVGWSLGGMFLAKYLSEQTSPISIKSLYLLAAPSGEFIDETGNDCGSFHFSMKNLANLTRQVKEVNVWHSKDDFVVDYKQALLYKKYVENVKFVTFEDKNHFLVPAFPELTSSIKGSN